MERVLPRFSAMGSRARRCRLAASALAGLALFPAAAGAQANAPIAITVDDLTVAEGDTGSSVATFVVGLTGRSSRPVTVAYATLDGTALVAEHDYGRVSGTLTFDPGATSLTVEVPVQGDVVEEADEVFFLVLSKPRGAELPDPRAEAEIVDDDGAAAPGAGAELSIVDTEVTEGTGGSTRVELVVELSEPVPVPVTVEYATTDDSATAGEDYNQASGRLRFPARTTVQRIRVEVIGDAADEGDEDFAVGLTNVEGAELGRDVGIVSILDDDAAGALTLEIVGSPERRARPRRTVLLQVRMRNTAGGVVARAPVHWFLDGDGALLDGVTTVTGRNGVATQRVRLGSGTGRLAVRADDDTHTETVLFQIAVADPPG